MTRSVQKLLFISCIVIAHVLSAQEHYLERYAVDPEVIALLDAHSELLAAKLAEVEDGSKKHGVWTFEWLPHYYVKYGLARIAGLEKMQEAINRCKLTSLYVADKRLYHVKGNPTALSNVNYAVVVKAAKAAQGLPPLTLEEVQQLCTLMHETGYISMSGTGAVRDQTIYERHRENSALLIPNHAMSTKTSLRVSCDF